MTYNEIKSKLPIKFYNGIYAWQLDFRISSKASWHISLVREKGQYTYIWFETENWNRRFYLTLPSNDHKRYKKWHNNHCYTSL